MNSSDALGMRRGRNVISQNKGTWEAVEEDILDVEELTHAVAGPAERPKVHRLKQSLFTSGTFVIKLSIKGQLLLQLKRTLHHES